MKYEFLTRRQKENKILQEFEESLIKNSVYSPNEMVCYKNRGFVLKYAEVRGSELQYFAVGYKSGKPTWIKEKDLAPSDQI